MSKDPKRRQVSLSLTPEEGQELDLSAVRTGHTATTFATLMFRVAFKEYKRVGWIEKFIDGVSQNDIKEEIRRQQAVLPPAEKKKKKAG